MQASQQPLNNRRAIITLYTEKDCPYGHGVRLIIAEKGIQAQIEWVDVDNKPDELKELNPYQQVLTLVDRDLVLCDVPVMMEYLDERFPHPPLMPLDPVSRAYNRMYRQRIKHDIYVNIDALADPIRAEKCREQVRQTLMNIAPIFAQKDYFMSDEYSLMDCYMAPLLWRLPHLGIYLDSTACQPLKEYAQRLFSRASFADSLNNIEQEMRL